MTTDEHEIEILMEHQLTGDPFLALCSCGASFVDEDQVGHHLASPDQLR